MCMTTGSPSAGFWRTGLYRTGFSRTNTIAEALSRSRGPEVLRASVCIGAMLALACNLALGQTSPSTPTGVREVIGTGSIVVIGTGDAALRCGPSDRYYPVARLAEGAELKVLEPDPRGGFLRVAYPSGQSVYVPKDAVELRDDRSLRVVRPTRLIALHAEAGVGGSWRSVLGDPLRVGSDLAIHETIRSETGEITGYKVEPPSGASAWVALSDLRRTGSKDPVSEAAGAADGAHVPTANPPDRVVEGAQASGAPALGRRSLLEAMVPPAGGAAAPIAAREQEDSGSTTANAVPGGDGATVPGTPGASATEGSARALATNSPTVVIEQGIGTPSRRTEALGVMELEALYQSARSSETFEDELEALLAEHRRTLEATPDDSFNERLREQLRQRIAYIEMRIAFRDGPAKMAAERASAPRISEQLQRRLDELRAGQEYVMIGRMVISRVYDGERLPKLYRVRSADALARTLGYVKSGDKDLTPYLDRVVGIAGPVESGPGGARVVTAVRVDLLDE